MKKILHRLGMGTLALGAMGMFAALPATAVRLADGRVFFNRPPQLVEATSLDHVAGLRGRYHFTVAIPADAGEPLEALRIAPRDHANAIAFSLDRSQATVGEAYARGPAIPLASVGGAADGSNDVLMVFDQPVQPGETVTVTLKTAYNPSPGVYLFGVTAYPAGEEGVGQFIGYGRLHIYESGN